MKSSIIGVWITSAIVILIGIPMILTNLVSTTTFNIGLALILLGLSNILLTSKQLAR